MNSNKFAILFTVVVVPLCLLLCGAVDKLERSITPTPALAIASVIATLILVVVGIRMFVTGVRGMSESDRRYTEQQYDEQAAQKQEAIARAARPSVAKFECDEATRKRTAEYLAGMK